VGKTSQPVDTQQLPTTFIPASGLRDQNQNPEILNTQIVKDAGDYNPAWPFSKPIVTAHQSGHPFYYDQRADVGQHGKSNSFIKWYGHTTQVNGSHFMRMDERTVDILDNYGNVANSNYLRAVSFLRPKYVKNSNAAHTVVSGTQEWTRTTDVDKGGSGVKVNPMSNSESQEDFELIGGQTYIHNQGNTSGQGAMAIAGNPVQVNIINKVPTRTIFSVYD
jgi:hypothetical protein